MTRMSKQGKRRAICPKKLKASFDKKTGPKKDNLSEGHRVHKNALDSKKVFIAKVK